MDLRNGLEAYASNQEGGSGTLTISNVSGSDELSACFDSTPFDSVMGASWRLKAK